MALSEAPIPIWTRAVADPNFRDALIADPLRALADAGNVAASADQVRQLEDMTPEQRAEFITEIVRDVHIRGGQARFGWIGEDGLLGGSETPPD
jgi:hypothetical protein